MGKAIGGIGKVVSSVLGGGQEAAPTPPPPPPPPAPAPLPDDENAKKARSRKMNAIRRRSGRESTNMTDSALGSFSNDKLG